MVDFFMIHPDTFLKTNFNGAKGLVFVEDKIIAYRRDNKTNNSPGLIDLPGGGPEANESPFETFKREVYEEFGIKIKEEDIIASFRKNSIFHPGTKSFFIVVKTKFNKNDIIFGNEGSEWMLMTIEEFINRHDGIERQQNRVREYLSGNIVSE